MDADDLLDQDRWPPPTPQPPAHSLTVDQQIRAEALRAAATWLAGETWTHPERRELLTVAAQLEQWIRTGQPVDPQPRPRPTASPVKETHRQ